MDQCPKATANALERLYTKLSNRKKKKEKFTYFKWGVLCIYDRKENIQKKKETLLVHDNRELADIVREKK
ncbi:hypothetical protein GHT06_013742 [Daphnia sinensis]|uniref:Uncharacterized protein n=1 Tax=Daphnia sinensis TaxID=1820382 RepID=A0AAD5KSM9_9CRUS|nr:hypothetical protein GHT06_013742 [Daphnia sinensis]